MSACVMKSGDLYLCDGKSCTFEELPDNVREAIAILSPLASVKIARIPEVGFVWIGTHNDKVFVLGWPMS
jgi:hypothetical protein